MRAFLVPALLAVLAVPAPALSQEGGAFDIALRGLTGARLAWKARSDAGGYAVSGAIATTGAIGLIARFAYEGRAEGRLRGGRPVPLRYEEQVRTPERAGRTILRYRGGTPRVAERTPPREPRPHDVDPSGQTGRLDPLTAMWLLLRDVDPGAVCDLDLPGYDGRRATRVRLTGVAEARGETVICNGVYVRQAGFPPEEMAERTRFPFTLHYGPAGDGRLRVELLRLTTDYGPATLTRRD